MATKRIRKLKPEVIERLLNTKIDSRRFDPTISLATYLSPKYSHAAVSRWVTIAVFSTDCETLRDYLAMNDEKLLWLPNFGEVCLEITHYARWLLEVEK